MEPTINDQSSEDRRKKIYNIITATIIAAVSTTLDKALPFLSRQEPRPKRTSSLGGAEYIRELLSTAHPDRIQDVLRMQLKPFQKLCDIMREIELLQDTRHIAVEEQLAMFLHVVGKGSGFRDCEERFQHSGETVYRHFHSVLDALTALVPQYIQSPPNDEIPEKITSDPKFYPYFENCLGAVDGTHIAVKVLAEEAAAYRNRKGFLSQNVMACCDLDTLKFTYVLAGWEGSAHDGLVFDKSFNLGFSIPEGKYYLGDAGYPLTTYCLTPYRGVRYHLKEWEKGNRRY
jgi:DDE superfamily endonuclease